MLTYGRFQPIERYFPELAVGCHFRVERGFGGGDALPGKLTAGIGKGFIA
jgi:hypothetical protein